jgi:hypothetical protein
MPMHRRLTESAFLESLLEGVGIPDWRDFCERLENNP